MFEIFIEYEAALLTLIGGFFLLKAGLGLSPKAVAELSKMKWGHNVEVAKGLCEEKSNTLVGFFLTLVASFCQIVLSLGNFSIHANWAKMLALKLALLVAVVVYIASSLWVKWHSENSFKKVQRLLKAAQPAARP